MKSFSISLVILFAFVGAHVPRAFTLMYLILGLSALMALQSNSTPSNLLPESRLRLFRVLQLLVLLFSLSYPLAMVHFGFWQLTGRQALDVLNAFLLPNALYLWGFYMARQHFQLFTACLLSYSIGGLVFLVSALIHTWGFDWFALRPDSGSLLLPWGNYSSMNVRSLEQNAILNIVLLPVGLYALRERRYRLSMLFMLLALIACLAVLPLANGRLWIVSLVLAAWPFGCFIFRSVTACFVLCRFSRTQILFALLFGSAIPFVFPAHLRAPLCDERFDIYRISLIHWQELIAGGRVLTFRSLRCDGHTSFLVSLLGHHGTDVFSLHNVPLDVLATVGLMAALPILVVLIFALLLFFNYALSWTQNKAFMNSCCSFHIFWSFVAVLVPQWFFQPLMYSDGLLYYISYAVIASLFVLSCEQLMSSCQQDA